MPPHSAAPPGFLPRLCLFAALLAALVNSGNMVSIDPVRRLQQARALWTTEPDVDPVDARIFGTLAYDGHRHATFGLGQPLVFLPFDIAVTTTLDLIGPHAPVTPHVLELLRIILIAWGSQTLLASLAACFGYLLLRRLGFLHAPATSGVLSLLTATTCLHYIQNCQENLLMLAMALIGAERTFRWLDDHRWRDAAYAGAAFGLSLLTRLTTLADAAGVLIALLLMLLWQKQGLRTAAQSLLSYAKGFVPTFAACAAIERLYQYHRFWTFRGTYYTPFLEPQPSTDRSGNMFNNPMLAGWTEPLFSPQNSIFLYDPLLLAALILVVVYWRRIEPRLRAFALGSIATLLAYLQFYSTYMSPTGEISWGDRYTETPVLLLSLLAAPLFCRFRPARPLFKALLALSVVQQIASILLMPSLEVIQWRRRAMPWSIPRRFVNIWLSISGQGGAIPYRGSLPPEWQRLNLLPFQLGLHYQALQPWAIAGWCLLLGITLALLWKIVHQCSQEDRAWAMD